MKNEEIKVSVIIPNYNHAIYLKERIDSILNQSFQNYEMIILDDCSTDNSKDVIELYRYNPHISHILYNKENTGSPFMQWDRGIQYAKGEYIWIAESDDTCLPSFLSELVPLLENHKEASLAFSHTFLINSKGSELPINWHRNSDESVLIHNGIKFAKQIMLNQNYISNASMVVFRRSIYYDIPKSYQEYHSCGDWAFWMSFCIRGQVIEVCKKLNYFRMHKKKVTVKAGQTGKDWIEVGSILTGFINQLSLKGMRLRLYRGKWTRDLSLSVRANKDYITKIYPQVFGGSNWDILLYRLSILYKKVINKIT